jgi:hypothetical protein
MLTPKQARKELAYLERAFCKFLQIGEITRTSVNLTVLTSPQVEALVERVRETGLQMYVVPGEEAPPCGYSRIPVFYANEHKTDWIAVIEPRTSFRLDLEVEPLTGESQEPNIDAIIRRAVEKEREIFTNAARREHVMMAIDAKRKGIELDYWHGISDDEHRIRERMLGAAFAVLTESAAAQQSPPAQDQKTASRA